MFCASCRWCPPGGRPESRKLVCWAQLHLCKLHGEPVVFVVQPVDSVATLHVPQVPPVHVGAVTTLVPPGACESHSTVSAILIIIPALGAELHAVVIRQRVSRRAWIRAHTHHQRQRRNCHTWHTPCLRPSLPPPLAARSAGRQVYFESFLIRDGSLNINTEGTEEKLLLRHHE